MGFFGSKPWWKDKKDGWPGHGVADFFEDAKQYHLEGDRSTAIEVLEWGKRFSREFGSGGAVSNFNEMIEKIENE